MKKYQLKTPMIVFSFEYLKSLANEKGQIIMPEYDFFGLLDKEEVGSSEFIVYDMNSIRKGESLVIFLGQIESAPDHQIQQYFNEVIE